ncbi:protein-lysine N-methyltransferase EEF2KMT isoform X2 [Dermacentor variabilis]|uniref:protein-lysine N-methyltransferase EEF2KMT isoform X2 n=1 Tax=Dermacentor variabilis TaxID=34621 RepID=UPI003F5C54A5
MCVHMLSSLCSCRRSKEIAGHGAERTTHRGISGAVDRLYYSPPDSDSFSTENSVHQELSKVPHQQDTRITFCASQLEADNIEIADSLYVHFAGKLGSVSGEEDVPGFVTYTIDDRTMVTLKEHTAVVINGTTGLRTWQASKFLSEWCLENRDLLRSKRIVELGCGVGLTGMVVCKTCCPLSYTFTDGHEAVLQSVEENLRRNSVTGCHARVEMLRWGDHENFREHCTADVILGADLVFDPAVVPALVATLAALLAHGGTAYIASTVRNHETRALFLSKLDEASLQYEPCTAPREKIFFYDRSCPVEIEKVTACPRNSKQV